MYITHHMYILNGFPHLHLTHNLTLNRTSTSQITSHVFIAHHISCVHLWPNPTCTSHTLHRISHDHLTQNLNPCTCHPTSTPHKKIRCTSHTTCTFHTDLTFTSHKKSHMYTSHIISLLHHTRYIGLHHTHLTWTLTQNLTFSWHILVVSACPLILLLKTTFSNYTVKYNSLTGVLKS